MRRPSHLTTALLATALAVASGPSLPAGGPLIVDPQTGTPYTWQVPLEGPPAAFFNLETGPLNTFIDHSTAEAVVLDALAAWQDIPSASITYSDAGPLRDCSVSPAPSCLPGTPLDVNSGNLFQVFGLADGQSPVIFDADGSVFALLGFPPGVLAFASPEIGTDGAPFAITEGLAAFNGAVLGNDAELIRAVMTHEFGHFSNLAHSSVNGEAIFFGDQTGPSPYDPFGFGPPPIDSIETMYPFLAVETGVAAQTPHRDDVASMSAIYPSATPLPSGRIEGRVLRSDGQNGISGVNVITRNVTDPFFDAVSALSGDFTQAMGPLGDNDGAYVLRGLEGGNYSVYIDQVTQGGFSTPPAFGFEEECYNGSGESSDPDLDDPSVCTLVSTAATITGIDVILQALPPDPYEPNDDPVSATPGGCGQTLSDPTIDPTGDLDYYGVDLLAEEKIVVDIDAADLGSSLDSLVGIFDTDGVTLLASNDDEAPFFLDSFLVFTAPQAGRYFIAVTAWDDFDFDGSSDSGSVNLSTGFYHIQFRCTPPPVPLKLETGRLLVDNQWKTVIFTSSFADPVVVAGPSSTVDGEETLVRIRNVTADGFQIRLQEWDFLDGSHPPESVSYVVVERGRSVLPDGSKIEAGRVSTDATGVEDFELVDFASGFPSTPVVLTTIGSNNDPSPVTTRVRSVAGSRFEVTMQEEEAADQVHGEERIYFLAWQQGQGSIPATLVGASEVPTLDYDTSTLGVTHLYRRLPDSSLEVQVQEERSGDAEVEHVQETVGTLRLGRYGQTPILLAQMQTTVGNNPAAVRWRQVPLTFETGTVTINHLWKTVFLTKSFSNPVVIAQSPTYYGANAGVIRVRNVTANSFQIHFQEWRYLDGLHTTEKVTYLVVEAGQWDLPNGSRLQAGFIDTDQAGVGDFLELPFLSEFPVAPVVLSTVNTFNGPQTVTTRLRQVGPAGFALTMQEEEALDQIHLTERIGFAAWEPGSGTLSGISFEVSSIPLAHEFSAVPGSPFEIKIDEEQSVDEETDHGVETVGFFLLDGNLMAGMQTTQDPDPANLRQRTPLPGFETGLLMVDHNWRTVSLEESYQDPVVVARPAGYNDPEPGVLRLRNVTANSFEIRFQEWLYLDGNHPLEEVAFLVMEAGRYFLDSGEQIEAGYVDRSNTGLTSFANVSFLSAFPAAPTVLTSIMTSNGNQTVTTRLRDVTNSGFQLTMQEEDANDQVHVVERIGYVAWAAGTGTAGANNYETGSGFSTNGSFTPLTFTQTFPTAPCVLADMQTADGPDPANLRYRNRSSLGVELKVAEESSGDAETNHLFEEIGFLALDCPAAEASLTTENLLVVSAAPGSQIRRHPTFPSLVPPENPRNPDPGTFEPGVAENEQCRFDPLIFPWFVSGFPQPEGPGAISALVVNPYDIGVDLNLIGLNLEGSERLLERRLIRPREVLTWTSDGAFPGNPLALQITAGRPLDGFILLSDREGRLSSQLSARRSAALEMNFALAVEAGLQDVALFLFNPGPHPAEMSVDLMDQTGRIVGQGGGTLLPRAPWTGSLARLIDSISAPPAYLRVTSSEPIVGVKLNMLSGILSEPARRLPDVGVAVPRFDGAGLDVRLVLHLINSGDASVRVDMENGLPGRNPALGERIEIPAAGMVDVALPSVDEPFFSPGPAAARRIKPSMEGAARSNGSSVLAELSVHSGGRCIGRLPLRNRDAQILLAPIPPAGAGADPLRAQLPGDGGWNSPLAVELFSTGGLRIGRATRLATPFGERLEFHLPGEFSKAPGYLRIEARTPVLRGGLVYRDGTIFPMSAGIQSCHE